MTPVVSIGHPGRRAVRGADPAFVRRSRAAYSGGGAALHGGQAASRLLDRGACGRGGRPLRHFRARAASLADDPARAHGSQDDRRSGLAAVHRGDPVSAGPSWTVTRSGLKSIVIIAPGEAQRIDVRRPVARIMAAPSCSVAAFPMKDRVPSSCRCDPAFRRDWRSAGAAQPARSSTAKQRSLGIDRSHPRRPGSS